MIIEMFLIFLYLNDKYYYQVKNYKLITENYFIEIIKYFHIKIAFFFAFLL